MNAKLVKSAPWIAGGLLVFAVGIVVFPGRTVTITEPATHPQLTQVPTPARPSDQSVNPLGQTPGLTQSAAEPLWQPANPVDYENLPSLREDVTGAELIAFDRSRLDAVAVGSEFNIRLPSDEQLRRVVIDRVERTRNGNRILMGVIDNRAVNRFVLTLGAQAVFGTLSTTAGVYNLSGKEGLAWIIEARALSHHVDPSLPDTVQPPVR